METNKKINYKFATAPVALFSVTTANEFKLISYLINLSNLTNNNIVSVSYSYLVQACNITCHKIIKKNIDNLITLGLLSRISGNITTNNSYIINYNKIIELENTNKVINEVPEQPEQSTQEEQQPMEQAPEQPIEQPIEQPMEEPMEEQLQPEQSIEEKKEPEQPVQEDQPQPEQSQPIEEEINNNNLNDNNNNNNMEEKEINNEELFAKVEEFILTKNNDIFFDWHETIEYLGAYFSKEERKIVKNNFDAFKKRQKLFTLYDRIKMELIAPTYTAKKEIKKEEYLPF